MRSKNVLIFVVFLAVLFLAVLPYLKHVLQKQTLDADLGQILLDYSTTGKKGFLDSVDAICLKAGLKPGTYEVKVDEDPNSRRVTVELSYIADFSIFFMHRQERVVLRNTTSNLGL